MHELTRVTWGVATVVAAAAMAAAVAAAVAAVAACGGGQTEADEPDDFELVDRGDPHAGVQDQGAMVPPEKYDEINQVFLRRKTQASRCFADAIETGKLDQNATGDVTLGLKITRAGQPQSVRVTGSTLRSEPVHDCLVDMVNGWKFASLPATVDFSYTYNFSRDY